MVDHSHSHLLTGFPHSLSSWADFPSISSTFESRCDAWSFYLSLPLRNLWGFACEFFLLHLSCFLLESALIFKLLSHFHSFGWREGEIPAFYWSYWRLRLFYTLLKVVIFLFQYSLHLTANSCSFFYGWGARQRIGLLYIIKLCTSFRQRK